MEKRIKEGPIPMDLYLKLTQIIYQMYQWGVPVSGAVEIGRVIMDNYWKKKNADKSGC